MGSDAAWIHQQCHGYVAAFARQNIVSAAGGLGIHGLNANLTFDQGAGQGRCRKAQALATAKNHQFSLQLGQKFKVRGGQVFKVPPGVVGKERNL